MTKSKKFADFINANGEYERISIWEVQRRERQQPGHWNMAKYFSTHRLETNKLKMTPSHTYNNKLGRNTHYFQYLAGQVEKSDKGGDGGESMTHMAYKDAISKLTNTRLIFKHKQLAFDIEVKKSELEKTFLLNGKQFRLDVYIEFTTEHEYGLRWNSRLGIEVCRSNALDLEKIEGLETLGIPIMQIKTHSKFEFDEVKYEDNEAKYNQHVDFLVKRFTQELRGIIYVDPESVEFLKQRLDEKDKVIASLNDKLSHVISKIKKYLEDNQRTIEHQKKQIAELDAKIAENTTTIKNLEISNTQLKQSSGEQRELLYQSLNAGFFAAKKVKANIRKYLDKTS